MKKAQIVPSTKKILLRKRKNNIYFLKIVVFNEVLKVRTNFDVYEAFKGT